LSPTKTRSSLREEVAKETENVATSVISTCNALLDLVLWAAENDVPVSDSMSSSEFKKKSEVITKKTFSNIYRVSIDTTFTWESVGGSISINIFDSNDIVFYRSNEPSTPVAVSIENDHIVYFYPPKDLDSVIFFLLNPKIDEEVLNILKSIEISPEVQLAITDYRAIVEKLPKDITDIEIRTNESIAPIDTYAIITLPMKTGTETLLMIEAYTDEDDEHIYYRISMRIDGENISYIISSYDNKIKALQLLLEKFVPRKELKMLKRWSNDILSAALKAYIIIEAMEKMTEAD